MARMCVSMAIRQRNYQRQTRQTSGNVESNARQRTVDYPLKWANGLHIALNS